MSEQLLDDSFAAFSEASHAFLLKDWERSGGIVESLLERAETSQEQDGQRNVDRNMELRRKLWILKITLIASTAASLPGPEKERQLSDVSVRMHRHYRSSQHQEEGSVLHPSLLVALALAGLKLQVPQFARHSLEEYFDTLLYAVTLDDSVHLDQSNADLSLSGLAVDAAASGKVREGWTKSLHRLARIYSIHVLGKTLGDWEEARIWIEYQWREDHEGIRLVGADNVQVRLSLLRYQP